MRGVGIVGRARSLVLLYSSINGSYNADEMTTVCCENHNDSTLFEHRPSLTLRDIQDTYPEPVLVEELLCFTEYLPVQI